MTTRTDTCEQPLVDPSAMLARAERRSVALCDLRVDPELTCRRQIAPGRVKLMAEALRAGSGLEPLVVAVIGNTVTLVDGQHRYRALISANAGRTDVLVLREVTTLEEARWTAFWLHWRAALPLTRKERRNGFRAYVEAGHLQATKFGRLKTYQAMSKELAIATTTLWRWMREDFPHIAAKLSRGVEDGPRPGKAVTSAQRAAEALKHHVGQIVLIAKHSRKTSVEAQELLVDALRTCGEDRPIAAVLHSSMDGYDF